jgi:predicted pyridoxine 5'-phosphate oxidase superfamily flavin-nucleotide-binding protein
MPVTDVAADDLRTIYPTPHERVIAKARPTLDVHSAKFIGLSPFCVMASAGPDGTVDASPRGGGWALFASPRRPNCRCRTVPATTASTPSRTC